MNIPDEEIVQEDEQLEDIVQKETLPVRIVRQEGGMLDGQRLISDTDKFRKLKEGSSEPRTEPVQRDG